jgi:hypothetical protein
MPTSPPPSYDKYHPANVRNCARLPDISFIQRYGPILSRVEARQNTSTFFFFVYSYWGETESLGTAATIGLLYQPKMIGEGDCGEIGGMKIGLGKPKYF